MSMSAFLDPAVRLVQLAVTGLARDLPQQLPGGARIAVAVVLVTWTVRAALVPLAVSAARSRRASAALAPQLTRLQQRYAGDPARLGRELRNTYRDAGVSPFAGILPTLAQLPVIGTMYRLVVVPVVAGRPNPVLDAVVLGVPLGGHWPGLIAAAGVFSSTALALVVLLLALTGLAWLSSRQLTRAATISAATTSAAPGGPSPRSGLTRVLRLLPFAAVGFAAIAPPAVGLYLLASTAWTVAERAFLPA
jgi:YidC/Oxa1 family membrane protein insertase